MSKKNFEKQLVVIVKTYKSAIAMERESFLPPPVRLSQECECEHAGGGVTRRTFIKRTGGATVATMVAWGMTVQHARAEEEEECSCSVSFMCAISPIHLDSAAGNTLDYRSFAGGGFISLWHKDDACAAEKPQNHRQREITSRSRIYVEADLPDNVGGSWRVYSSPEEVNDFLFRNCHIERDNRGQVQIKVRNEDVSNSLGPGDLLAVFLETTSVVRSSQSVEIFVEAWLEGTVGTTNFNKDNSFVSGSGISMVLENGQEPHTYPNCEVKV